MQLFFNDWGSLTKKNLVTNWNSSPFKKNSLDNWATAVSMIEVLSFNWPKTAYPFNWNYSPLKKDKVPKETTVAFNRQKQLR